MCASPKRSRVQSPYNTRNNPGLPPTPIANVSRASLEAALNPDPGDEIYYVLDPNLPPGHHFFTASAHRSSKPRRHAAKPPAWAATMLRLLRSISGSTRVAGVIGTPVRHSLSPAIVNTAFEALGIDWSYFAFEVAARGRARGAPGMRALRIGGLSVTMPHKDARRRARRSSLAAMPTLWARSTASCSTVTSWSGRTPTARAFSMRCGRIWNSIPHERRRRTVLGAGGAARAVVYALARAGIADVAVVNRTRANAEPRLRWPGPRSGRDAVDAVPEADLVVNATPFGMTDGGMAVDPALLRAGQAVVDLIYHPSARRSWLPRPARRCAVANGLGMLVQQAAMRCGCGPGSIHRSRRCARRRPKRRGPTRNLDKKYPD